MKSEDLYAHLDKDRDGEISPAEFRQMELTSEHKKVYGVFDKDGDRDITGGGQIFWLNLLLSLFFKFELKKQVWCRKVFDPKKPEELIDILLKLGEVPTDLQLFFNDMSTEITTDYRTIVNFLLVVMKYSKFVQSFKCL